MRIVNNLFIADGGHSELVAGDASAVTFTFNQLYGYAADGFENFRPASAGDDVAGTNCIVDDVGVGDCGAGAPGLVDVAAGSFTPTAGSPLLDAGDDSELTAAMTTDLLGAARVAGAGVDVGAVERP